MKHFFLISVGGGLGALCRYILSNLVSNISLSTFPIGTLVVNLLGSFLLGVIFYLTEKVILHTEIRGLVTIGFLSSFTTLSTFTLETSNLLREGELGLSFSNILLTNLLGIILIFTGMYTAKLILGVIK